MKQYQSNKKVAAEPMTSTQWTEYRKHLTNFSDASLENGLEGYMVVYNRGDVEKEYWSWSPKDIFEEGYEVVIEKQGVHRRMPKFA